MIKTFKWLAIILVLLISFYGSCLFITKGITSFKTGDLAGIIFVVGILIYFVIRVIKGVKEDSKEEIDPRLEAGIKKQEEEEK